MDTGKISFTCSNFDITAVDKNISYNIAIDGSRNTVRTGDMADNIELITNGQENYIYSGGGNDTFTVDAYGAYVDGEGGDDTFNIINDAYYIRAFGREGNDTFNISTTDGAHNFHGGAGDGLDRPRFFVRSAVRNGAAAGHDGAAAAYALCRGLYRARPRAAPSGAKFFSSARGCG